MNYPHARFKHFHSISVTVNIGFLQVFLSLLNLLSNNCIGAMAARDLFPALLAVCALVMVRCQSSEDEDVDQGKEEEKSWWDENQDLINLVEHFFAALGVISAILWIIACCYCCFNCCTGWRTHERIFDNMQGRGRRRSNSLY
ncbi:unnamed protein product [Allacma fusca]|uniref:Uncharacterized protein n=1 Tax=Allacma fusca TaxID=39272 RepID=A0A8J2PLW1_9HEXA|nr:unnamed protein product [Allacma fusca]